MWETADGITDAYPGGPEDDDRRAAAGSSSTRSGCARRIEEIAVQIAAGEMG